VTVRYTLLVLVLLIAAGAGIVRLYDVDLGEEPARRAVGLPPASARPKPPPRSPYATRPAAVQLRPRFKRAPRAAMLFDLRTGRVLWSRNPNRIQPIASLAKMMTAVVVNDRARPGERAYISRRAAARSGSKVGALPRGRRVRLETLLYGLMLPSGNDAAVALAEHVGGDVDGFVDGMNARARLLGLRCSHFSSPDGLEDRGNTSCPRDMALLAREVLRRPRLARVVRTEYIALPSLIPHRGKVRGRTVTVLKPGRLHLASHNPLLRADYPGATGIKTGWTPAAGRCFVGTATRRGVSLGVVLLGSPDPGGQAARVLNRGFAAMRGLVRSG
jgi:serine-type D-Ala-D-Ala carboxypeptidase (penicillin-binding protein 5/6)